MATWTGSGRAFSAASRTALSCAAAWAAALAAAREEVCFNAGTAAGVAGSPPSPSVVARVPDSANWTWVRGAGEVVSG